MMIVVVEEGSGVREGHGGGLVVSSSFRTQILNTLLE